MKTARILWLAAAVMVPACATVSAAQQHETIVTADRIYTSDDFRPVVEALLIRGDKVEFAAGPRSMRRCLER